MKNKYLPFLAILSVLFACKSPFPISSADTSTSSPAKTEIIESVEEINPPAATIEITSEPPNLIPEGFDLGEREIFRDGLILSEQGVLSELHDATRYDITLYIPEKPYILKGHEVVRYTNCEDLPLEEIYFQLFPNVEGGEILILSVSIDSNPMDPEYDFEDSAMRLPLIDPLEPGQQIVIEIVFEIEVALEMGGNYGLFGYFEDILVLDLFYPVIPVFDDEGWNVKDIVPQGDFSYFDVSFYQVEVTAPADLSIATSGIEIKRELLQDEQVITYAAGPARDFYIAASKRFTVISEIIGETTINSYAPEEYSEAQSLALDIAVNAMEGFNSRFGNYPYTEFDVISTPMLALGIEYPGATGISTKVYDLDKEVWGLPAAVMLESALAHEVGHEWFYSTVGNDQVDEPWLDEAVVQYLTMLYYLDRYGVSAAAGYSSSWEDRWNNIGRQDIPIGLPAEEYNGSEYSAIVYGRGPIFIEALSKEMGEDAFNFFLRDYYNSYKWGIVTGDIFRQLAEKHCSCDLTDIFAEWVY
jgi:hypothetical protein